jgi:Cu(I)/Ag(I) efflux system membrane fusion protein
MRSVLRAVLIVLLAILSGAAGFLVALQGKPEDWLAVAAALRQELPAPTNRKKILYYRNPMGLPDTSPVPKKDSMGMDYIAVYEDEAEAAAGQRQILYYRNPMGLPDTSPVPKKDSIGMDYIPVYADEGNAETDPSVIKVSIEKVQRAGVVSEAVERRSLADAIHVPGTVQLDERRERSITMRAEGFIEEVYAGATGQTVKAGEPLFRIYSPQIVQAAVDYRVAAAQGQRETGARKLRNYGAPESYIRSIPARGDIPLSLDWPSPVDGVLMRKNIVVGARVMPGDEIYRLADVSTVWVIADVPEQDAGRVKPGDPAAITVRAHPGETFLGEVAFILPELKAETRTAQVRIELPNPGHKLLHQMYADVTIEAARGEPVLAVPASAIIDSGLRQVAIVDLGEGKFAPRPVKLGRKGGEHVEILSGLKPGDKVVTKANFLIDAESNLKAALTALTTAEASQP